MSVGKRPGICALKEEQVSSIRRENGRFFLAERTMCSKLWCSEREHRPFRDLNASVALVPDEGKGGERGG